MKRCTLTVVLILAALAAGALEVPYLGGRINDLAGMIDAETRQQLETRLEQLEKDTGAQVAILILPSLEGEVLEDFALKVAETWQLGRKDIDDGVLILVAEAERKIRIEVGYGLEGAIPDVTAKRIIDGLMTPRFREGDFSGGISAAVDALDKLIRGEAVDLPEPGSGTQDVPLAAQIMGMGIFTIVVGLFSFIALFGKGGQSWFLYFFLMPFYGAFPTAFLGPKGLILFVIWVVGFPIVRIMTWHTDWGRSFRTTHPGLITAATSSGSGSGGFSSGGFSGGGGSFGGGGASGGW